MAVAMYQWTLMLTVMGGVVMVIIIGPPVLALLLYLLDHYDVYNIRGKKRWIIPIFVPLFFAPLYGYLTDRSEYHTDRVFDQTMKRYDISVPMYYATNVSFPDEFNQENDFGIDKTLNLVFGFSDKDVSKLEVLAEENKYWVKNDSVYLFTKDDMSTGERTIVNINVNRRRIYTRYHHRKNE